MSLSGIHDNNILDQRRRFLRLSGASYTDRVDVFSRRVRVYLIFRALCRTWPPTTFSHRASQPVVLPGSTAVDPTQDNPLELHLGPVSKRFSWCRLHADRFEREFALASLLAVVAEAQPDHEHVTNVQCIRRLGAAEDKSRGGLRNVAKGECGCDESSWGLDIKISRIRPQRRRSERHCARRQRRSARREEARGVRLIAAAYRV